MLIQDTLLFKLGIIVGNTYDICKELKDACPNHTRCDYARCDQHSNSNCN